MIDRHQRLLPGLLLYRFDALASPTPATSAAGSASWSRPPTRRWVVVAAEPITDIDSTAADTLQELLEELHQDHVTLAFAGSRPGRPACGATACSDAVGADRFFPTVGTAVDGYVAATGTTWVDWEERRTPTSDAPHEVRDGRTDWSGSIGRLALIGRLAGCSPRPRPSCCRRYSSQGQIAPDFAGVELAWPSGWRPGRAFRSPACSASRSWWPADVGDLGLAAELLLAGPRPSGHPGRGRVRRPAPGRPQAQEGSQGRKLAGLVAC